MEHKDCDTPNDCMGFLQFILSEADALSSFRSPRTIQIYRLAAKMLSEALLGDDVALDRVDATLISRFEAYLSSRKVVGNTSSFYMRALRVMYNRAAERGLCANCSPFRRVYTGVAKTAKRALSASELRSIAAKKLDDKPKLMYARDIFLFLFRARGMSMVDAAHLRRTDISGSLLTYCRRKTGHRLAMAWTPEMQAISDRYAEPGSPYLLPIIRDGDSANQVKNATQAINRQLKRLGNELMLPIDLTTYVARHSWASTAQRLHIPTAVISAALGHDSEATTKIYLAGLEASQVDEANAMVMLSTIDSPQSD